MTPSPPLIPAWFRRFRRTRLVSGYCPKYFAAWPGQPTYCETFHRIHNYRLPDVCPALR